MEQKKRFVLMNQNRPVLEFDSVTDEFQEVYLEATSEAMDVLPLGFTDIHEFVGSRRVPKDRAHMQELLQQTGCYRLDVFLTMTMALSLNDTYWVRPGDSTLTWQEVSLYQNDFNDIIAQLAFHGGAAASSLSSTSPEFSTDGAYAKCWIREQNQIVLVKTGSGRYGREPVSDYYAAQLAQLFCHNAVSYRLDTHHGRLVSKCNSFTNEETGFVPAMKLLDSHRLRETAYLLQFFQRLGFEEAFRRMVILDGLILNVDRHPGNYGFLVQNDSQTITAMAHVFDHNRSLAYAISDLDIHSLTAYLKTISPRIGTEFNYVAHKMLTEELKGELRNLLYFEFVPASQQETDIARARFLSEMVTSQIQHILQGRDSYHYVHLPRV